MSDEKLSWELTSIQQEKLVEFCQIWKIDALAANSLEALVADLIETAIDDYCNAHEIGIYDET